jgi:hypothetical protein
MSLSPLATLSGEDRKELERLLKLSNKRVIRLKEKIEDERNIRNYLADLLAKLKKRK